MIIELAADVQVRVPDDKLPPGIRGPIFITATKGMKVNYSADKKQGLHRFQVYTDKYGLLHYACTVEPTQYPAWV
jgi:hypothetical protein